MEEGVDKRKNGRLHTKRLKIPVLVSASRKKKKKNTRKGWLGQEEVFQTGKKQKQNLTGLKGKEIRISSWWSSGRRDSLPSIGHGALGWEGFAKLLKMSENQSAQLGA